MSFDDFHAFRAKSPDDIVYDHFSKRVREKLGYYVYRLVDPRNSETFYVGRGVGNRVFDHMDEAREGKRSSKTKRINEIHGEGWRVATIIHRHGLRDDDETGTLEAALIQAYDGEVEDGLTNKVSGEGTREFGARTTDQAIRQYDDDAARFLRHRCVLLSISDAWPKDDDDEPIAWSALYNMSRHGWKIDRAKADKADFVVIQARGIVRAAFIAEEWLPSDDPVFSGFPRPKESGTHGFVGRPAPYPAWEAWVGRRVPDKYRTRWNQTVRYVNL